MNKLSPPLSTSGSSARASIVTSAATTPEPDPPALKPVTTLKRGSSSHGSPHTRIISPLAATSSPATPSSTRGRKRKSRPSSPQKPRPPPKLRVAIHLPNLQHLFKNFSIQPKTATTPPKEYTIATPDVPLVQYLETKAELFPEPRLEPPKPSAKSRKRVRFADEVEAEKPIESTRGSPAAAAIALTNGERARKRARLEKETTTTAAAAAVVSEEDAMRWATVIGRLVKGKTRLTPEVLIDVGAALDDMEARNKKNEAWSVDVLEDGLMDAVRRLRDFEDEDYLLEGLRARAVALLTGWKRLL